jgi:hypothetical protein
MPADIIAFPTPKPPKRKARRRSVSRELELEHEILELRMVIADLACDLMRARSAIAVS